MPGKYRKIKDGKSVTGEWSDSPKYKEQRYEIDTPTFESAAGGNAGQGTRGQKVYKVGGAEYDRPKMSKKW